MMGMMVFFFCICGGEFEHPLVMSNFRGYGDPLPRLRDWRGLARMAGVDEAELPYVKGIAWREDRWRNRRHRHPGVAGLFGQKGRVSPCPVAQLKWADRYARSRYGSWRKALLHHKRHGWW
jgi:hypothetical protein